MYNVFVPLHLLQQVNQTPGDASALLIEHSEKIETHDIASLIDKKWQAKDGGLHVRSHVEQGMFEIYSNNIFLPDSLIRTVGEMVPEAKPVSTWFVNAINRADRSTPYSFVSTTPNELSLSKNQIALGQWAADDLEASVGDSVMLRYFVPSGFSGLREDSCSFVVAAILPEKYPWVDSTLMPPYPGLAKAGSCTDWAPGIPVDLDKVRPKDEKYWERHRGAPKAFINYTKATQIWDNRFGTATSVRIPSSASSDQKLTDLLNSALSPADFGLHTVDIKESTTKAVEQGISFAPLFIGLSIFTILGALILVWLLSHFLIQSRTNDLRVLSAAGFTRSHLYKLFMFEGVFTVSLGTTAGILFSPLYTTLMLKALGTVWHAAAMTSEISLHIRFPALIVGGIATIGFASIVIFLSLNSVLKAFYLQNKRHDGPPKNVSGRFLFSFLLIIAGIGSSLLVKEPGSTGAAGIFFVSGSVLLSGMLFLFSTFLLQVRRNTQPALFSWKRLCLSNLARGRGRSVATVSVLACALFILGTIQIFKLGSAIDPHDKSGGTGGFWWYGEFSTGVPKEDVSAEALRTRGISIQDDEYTILAMRMKDGDDASCTNLNRVNQPTLLGTTISLLDSLNCFSFAAMLDGIQADNAWSTLDTRLDENTIFGIADQNSMEWIMGKSVGDTLKYIDDNGSTLNVVLAAGLKNSVLHGKVIISEKYFIRHFPSTGGYRLFLSGAQRGKELPIGDALNSFSINKGGYFIPSTERLQSVNSVTNAYLSIFSLLGMLGLLLGSLGLGIVFVRNIDERRFELATLETQGFSRKYIGKLLFFEHAVLVMAGVFAGLIPAIFTSAASVGAGSVIQILILLTIVLVAGFGLIFLGMHMVYHAPMLSVLQDKNE